MKAYNSPCFQTDPVGLARFVKQNVLETKTTINETKTSKFKDGERFMLTEIGGASQPSEEEADSQGDRSAHGCFIQEADCNASQDEDSSVEFDGGELDGRKFALDYKEAVVKFREEQLKEREERLCQLEKIEQMYWLQNAGTQPSNQEGERAKNEAEEKTQEAIKALQSAEQAGGGEALGEARRSLEASCTKGAASAVMIVADVAKNCERTVREAVKEAERAVRDVLVMRCRCQAVPGDKDSFLETVEEAFGGSLEQKLKAKILLSYHKITRDKVNKFPSKNQIRNARRGGPRPRRQRGTRGDAPAGPVPEDSGGAAEVTRVPLRGFTPEAKSAEVFNPIDMETLDVGARAGQHINVHCASFWEQNHRVTGLYGAAFYMEAPWEYLRENHFEIGCASCIGWGNA